MASSWPLLNPIPYSNSEPYYPITCSASKSTDSGSLLSDIKQISFHIYCLTIMISLKGALQLYFYWHIGHISMVDLVSLPSTMTISNLLYSPTAFLLQIPSIFKAYEFASFTKKEASVRKFTNNCPHLTIPFPTYIIRRCPFYLKPTLHLYSGSYLFQVFSRTLHQWFSERGYP